jgi:hypothetical protein
MPAGLQRFKDKDQQKPFGLLSSIQTLTDFSRSDGFFCFFGPADSGITEKAKIFLSRVFRAFPSIPCQNPLFCLCLQYLWPKSFSALINN